ncbi:MAG: hypothetical protein OEZ06_13445 [Myxococcales bacterium]|nr:hypothetical protein [Myxococcales bacterium]
MDEQRNKPAEDGESRESRLAKGAEGRERDATPSVPILIPKVYAEAHRRDSEAPPAQATPERDTGSSTAPTEIAAPASSPRSGSRWMPTLALVSALAGAGLALQLQQQSEDPRPKAAVAARDEPSAQPAATPPQPLPEPLPVATPAAPGETAVAAAPAEPPAAPAAAAPSEAAQPAAGEPETPGPAVATTSAMAQNKPRARSARRGARPATAKTKKPAQLAEEPSRADIVAAMRKVQAELQACGGERRGVAELQLQLDNSGRVRHANVGGDFAGTKEGSCMARAARKARTNPFKRESYSVLFPVSI